MTYEKQNWQTGETITKEKLNHMEDGIANAGGGDGVRTCVALTAGQTGSSTEAGTPFEIAVTCLGDYRDSSKRLSFQDLYALHQEHDLIISIFDGTFGQLLYDNGNPSWGVEPNFTARSLYSIDLSGVEISQYSISIKENSMTATQEYSQLIQTRTE